LDLPEETASDLLEDLLSRICGRLQLSPARHRQADERYRAVAAHLDEFGTALAPFKPRIYPQGSLRIGTTVHLKGTDEFDLDAVCELHLDWTRSAPLAVLDAVQARLSESKTYSGMLERKNRCIRLIYANEFWIDILPAAPDPTSGEECLMVPDRRLQEWVPSNPVGYANWFESRATRPAQVERLAMPLPAQEDMDSKPILKMAVQLLKRWRDVRYEADPDRAPISIVLTTLAGQHYGAEETTLEGLFQIVKRIRASLPGSGRLKVCNPSNLREDLSERWDTDQSAYDAFAEGMLALQDSLRAMRAARGIPSAKAILGELFGEKLVENLIDEQAREMEKKRQSGGLRVVTASGSLTTATGSGTAPIRRNTFYGD
jgi:hypothetical protein